MGKEKICSCPVLKGKAVKAVKPAQKLTQRRMEDFNPSKVGTSTGTVRHALQVDHDHDGSVIRAGLHVNESTDHSLDMDLESIVASDSTEWADAETDISDVSDENNTSTGTVKTWAQCVTSVQ